MSHLSSLNLVPDLFDDFGFLKQSRVSEWSLDLQSTLREDRPTTWAEDRSCRDALDDEVKFLMVMLLLALWAVALIVVFVNL